MDYSQVIASQMINKDPRTESEDAFYDRLGFEGYAKLQGFFTRLNKALTQAASAAPRAILRRIRYT